MIRGHATPQQDEYVLRLESIVNAAHTPIEQMLELGILYIDPCHEPEKAKPLFEAVLARDPDNCVAKLWLADCYVRYYMNLTKAKPILQELIASEPKFRGAAYMLLSLALDTLDTSDNPLTTEKINLLENSVMYEPNWTSNHAGLSWAYQESGQLPEAVTHMQKAIANIIDRDPSWSYARETFETEITGRVGHGRFLKSQLEKMLQQIKI